MFNAFFFDKFTEFCTYELRSIASSDTNGQSMGKEYLPQTCNDLVSSSRLQDFSSLNATSCSFPQKKFLTSFLVSLLSGSDTVARSGMNLVQKFTWPKKLRTSAADSGLSGFCNCFNFRLGWSYPSCGK